MSNNNPKWDISDVIFRGKQSLDLYDAHSGELGRRLKTDEIETLRTGVPELEMRRSGQPETLNVLKTSTKGKNLVAQDLLTLIMDTRGQVKAATSNPEILQAFGVGQRIQVGTQVSLRTGANLVINAYNKYREWCSEAGILEQDIEEIKSINDKLTETDSMQEKAKFDRKVKTVDKGTLQRELEDIITKISFAGVKEFRTKNPSVVPLFEGLIPGSGTTAPSDNPAPVNKNDEKDSGNVKTENKAEKDLAPA